MPFARPSISKNVSLLSPVEPFARLLFWTFFSYSQFKKKPLSQTAADIKKNISQNTTEIVFLFCFKNISFLFLYLDKKIIYMTEIYIYICFSKIYYCFKFISFFFKGNKK